MAGSGFGLKLLREEGGRTAASRGAASVPGHPAWQAEKWVPSMLKKTELVEFRSLLLVLQARLRGDVQHLADGALRRSDGDGDSKSPTHIAELGTDNYEQDFSLRFVENEQEILDEISLALKKIDDGTYGLCEKCLAEGKPPAKAAIIKERLKAIPYVRTCVHCAEQQRTRKWRR